MENMICEFHRGPSNLSFQVEELCVFLPLNSPFLNWRFNIAQKGFPTITGQRNPD